jgi:1-acyl-sn-glycerol-3-phosphate acyltransferase
MRRLWRLVSFVAVCLSCWLASVLAQSAGWRASAQTRGQVLARITQAWARALLWLLGLQVESAGAMPTGHFLLVANHQSYLDILIVAARFPAQFVAKCEVSRWPLLGWLAASGGTIFIERESTASSVQCVYRVCRALRAGASIHVFPEGTTSNGTRVLPFKPLLLAAAVRTGTPVLPLTIKFTGVNGTPLDDETRDVLCWHGAMDFARHFWRLLAVSKATAQLVIHQPLAVTRKDSARGLTQTVQSQIADELAASASHDRARDRAHERKLTWHVITKTSAPIAPKTSNPTTA